MKYLLLLLAGIFLHTVSHSQGCVVNYVDPSFQLQKTDPSCAPNTGNVSAINRSGGVAPFTYKLVETNTTNASGVFSNLPAGLYTVEMRDACGTVRTRQATLVPWSFSFTFNVNKVNNCSDGEVVFSPTPQATSYTYGVVRAAGDTIWSGSHTIDLKLQKTLTVVVKDACGTMHSQVWHAPNNFLPYIAALQYRLQCDKFDLFPVYYGFEDPEVCLYEHGTDKLIGCKSATGSYTGGALTNFFDVPWGAYYVIIQDKCYRDSMYHPDMRSAGGSELNPYNWDCTTFTMHVDGMEDTVCLYNAVTNQLISCKGQDTVSINPRTGVPWPSGAVWDSLPYGSYYAWVYDPCEDSTFKIDSTVVYPFRTYSNAFPGCSLNQTIVQATFNQESKRPFTMSVFNSNGTLNQTFTLNHFDNYIGITPDSTNGPMTLVCTDACGHGDTTVVTPAVTHFSKSISIYNKCPGLMGNGGSGDVTVFASTFTNVTPVPTIIKKNGADTTITYNFQQNGNYEFANVPSGTYVIRYSFTNCSNMVVHDTVTVNDYVYPAQNADTAIQCGGNQFNFIFPVVGGLTPYTFQIIGNTPALPSLVTPLQLTPSFVVGNGQHYTSVKVRAIDRCGNSTIGDIAVQPINGCNTLLVDTLASDRGIANGLAKVYPNPSRGPFTIAISQRKKSDYRIEVVNAAGIKVLEKQIANADRKDVTINGPLAPGLYVIRLTDLKSGTMSLLKLVVQ